MLCEGEKLDDDDDFNLSAAIGAMGRYAAFHLENEFGTHGMDHAEFLRLFETAGLSASAFAEKLKMGARAVRRMLKDEQAVPPGLAAEMRRRWGS